ncbi:MAG TPA: S8 family serine peptidase, partial [Streptosporangiaceae bacterium]|nr:S8 family serine peptidase [Streptosporangiaceae bacterium]
ISVARTIGRAGPAGSYPNIAVIETTAERAAALAAEPYLYVEIDQPLTSGLAPATQARDVAVAPIGDLQRVIVQVRDDGGRPIEDAAVCLLGGPFPAAAYTGEDGRVELSVPADTVTRATEMLVRPRRGCWPVRVSRPLLRANETVTVTCERITTSHPEFPERALDSWGARAMGFDRLPPTHRGHGVRIALVDTGTAIGHPDLSGRITEGRDIVGGDDKSWQEDSIGAGTHHAVLIAGRDDGTGVVGLAPEAEVHVCRIAPGGWSADLIEALDYCIEQQIDVALIAAGVTEPSWLLADKAQEALQSGVACVAAAGDAAGPVAYPAGLPGVLGVGAIGCLGTFPPGSGYAAQLTGLPTVPDGFFAARFGNSGAGLDCCAPGVAIISGLPPATYGPLDGTATAAAHVAAVAGLVLAHHPQFRPEPGRPPMVRDASRVLRLFQVILSSCRPLPQLDPARAGAGLPDAAVAAGAAPWGTHAPLRTPFQTEFSGSLPAQAAPAGQVTAGQAGAGPVAAGPVAAGQAAAALAPVRAAMRSAGLITDEQ